MLDKMANPAPVTTKFAGAFSAMETIADFATKIAAPANITYDNEVNYRPAAQQWTVCTP